MAQTKPSDSAPTKTEAPKPPLLIPIDPASDPIPLTPLVPSTSAVPGLNVPKPIEIVDRTLELAPPPPMITEPGKVNTAPVTVEDRSTPATSAAPATSNRKPVVVEDRTSPVSVEDKTSSVPVEDKTKTVGEIPPAPNSLPDMKTETPVSPEQPNSGVQLPGMLDRPIEPTGPRPEPVNDLPLTPVELLTTAGKERDPTLGFSGRSGVIPRSGSNDDFMQMEDRWRVPFAFWDRYDQKFPFTIDYPYKIGHWWDPYNQNVLKGDYPIIGQNTFFNLTIMNTSLGEARQVPTPTTPFESTARPRQFEFFGRPNAAIFNNLTMVTFDLFHGDAAFKPIDWRLKISPAFNTNLVNVEELGVLSNDVRKGTTRSRQFWSLQEWFGEVKLADLSPEYDFVSLRVGSQPFTSDFRGFIFSDINRGIRLFGNLNSNRTQYNLAIFRQAEKDTNSGLNTFQDRRQTVAIANIFQQDFIYPGYTLSGSVHYNNDRPSVRFDKNNILVRPDPAGIFQPHGVEALYLGIAGDGHLDRYNVSHAFYWVTGRDSKNPIAGKAQDINAFMGALELSYDRDWARFRASGFYASGDGNVNNNFATGFDTILDAPAFAGEFSFINRQQIGLFGVNLFQRNSLVPDLRSSKIQGQSNFVNPGLFLVNAGVDFDITPKLRMINNANFLWFDKTNVLETFVFQGSIDREIGVDLSCAFEYRPLLTNNILVMFGASTLLPSSGFKDLYNRLNGHSNPLAAAFLELTFMY